MEKKVIPADDLLELIEDRINKEDRSNEFGKGVRVGLMTAKDIVNEEAKKVLNITIRWELEK